jgi:hypothetical protein
LCPKNITEILPQVIREESLAQVRSELVHYKKFRSHSAQWR